MLYPFSWPSLFSRHIASRPPLVPLNHTCAISTARFTPAERVVYLFLTPATTVLGELKVPFSFEATDFEPIVDTPLIIVRGQFYLSHSVSQPLVGRGLLFSCSGSPE